MAKIHVGSDNFLYSDNGDYVKYEGKKIKRWESDLKRWSFKGGAEIGAFKGKSLIEVANLLGYTV